MKKTIQPIITALIALVPFCTLSADGIKSPHTSPDTLAVILKTFGLDVSESEYSFVFSSMDWYRTVSVYDADNGATVMRMNVKKEARKQTSQLVFVPLSFFAGGDYIIVLRKGKYSRAFRMLVHDGTVILGEMDMTV